MRLLARGQSGAQSRAGANAGARAHAIRAKKGASPEPGDGSTGTAGEQEGHWRSGSIMRKNYRCKKKTVLALIQRRCQIAVVRFGVCRFRANGVENDGVTPKRGKSGRSERGGKPREGTQPGCRKPEERPPRHGGCGARAGRIWPWRSSRSPPARSRRRPASSASPAGSGFLPCYRRRSRRAPPPAGCILLRGGRPPPPKF